MRYLIPIIMTIATVIVMASCKAGSSLDDAEAVNTRTGTVESGISPQEDQSRTALSIKAEELIQKKNEKLANAPDEDDADDLEDDELTSDDADDDGDFLLEPSLEEKALNEETLEDEDEDLEKDELTYEEEAESAASSVDTDEIGEDMHAVFVTSSRYKGNLKAQFVGNAFDTGMEGADFRCQWHAEEAGLPGRWVSLLSDAIESSREKIVVTGEVVNMAGKVVAEDADQLFGGKLKKRIAFDEYGTRLKGRSGRAWTGSKYDGASKFENCANWESSSRKIKGGKGKSKSKGHAWLAGRMSMQKIFDLMEKKPEKAEKWKKIKRRKGLSRCNKLRRLYCISQ